MKGCNVPKDYDEHASAYANHFTSGNSPAPIPPDGEPLDATTAEAVGRLVAAFVGLGYWDGLDAFLGRGRGPVHDDPEGVGRLVEYHVARGEFRRARDVLAKAAEDAGRAYRAREQRERLIRETGHCPAELLELAEVVSDVRTLGLLERFGIVTVEQLVAMSPDDLRGLPYLGARMFQGIVDGLDRARVKHSFG